MSENKDEQVHNYRTNWPNMDILKVVWHQGLHVSQSQIIFGTLLKKACAVDNYLNSR